MKNRKRDGKPLLAVKALVASLPLLLKIALVYLKYKRITKKRKKIFEKTLKKEGLDEKVAEKLSDELPEINIRDFFSNGVGKINI
ncbi:MAG: hypothetical protein ACOCSJ_03595 [Candidatus Natronoplasma sp.]